MRGGEKWNWEGGMRNGEKGLKAQSRGQRIEGESVGGIGNVEKKDEERRRGGGEKGELGAGKTG